jgi:branched-chain amino acid aminotransferase
MTTRSWGKNVSLGQTFNGDALLELVKRLVRIDQAWIPKEPGHSLYVRPTLSECRT